jgi:hypothetical protein
VDKGFSQKPSYGRSKATTMILATDNKDKDRDIANENKTRTS